jgi:hypothetical protein
MAEASMGKRAKRITVDLAAYPDLVVIYLGMRVNAFAGIATLLGFGPKIAKAVSAQPDGLLKHETVLYSLRHIGMRQYWRDFAALERWARSEPHARWWREFLRDRGGTGFWHEAYFMRGGMEAVYVDMTRATGFRSFAPELPATGPMFSARQRGKVSGTASAPPPVSEESLGPSASG